MSSCLFIVSAPSGAGKTSLVSALLGTDRHVRKSVSYTTRAPRTGEENGVHYNFVDAQQFGRMKAQGDFLETALVHDNEYGTSRLTVESECAASWTSVETTAGSRAECASEPQVVSSRAAASISGSRSGCAACPDPPD